VLRLGYRTILADGGVGALGFATQRKDIALILLDLAMPDMDGLTVLARMREAGVATPVIALAREGELAGAMQAVRLGALDFVTRPASAERLQLSVANALKLDTLAREVRRGRSLRSHLSLADFTARSPDMERVLIGARRAAPLDAPLLIEGEPGTGKEALARAVCAASVRAHGPFVTVDCRALTAENADRVLFGTGKDGAAGKLSTAGGGTLFLNEVGALPRAIQGRLLTALQPGSCGARVMASSTVPLSHMVDTGQFHAGLARLLGSFSLAVPPLRDRVEDISQLVHHFTMRYAAEERRSHIAGVAPQVTERLKTCRWPGNVRELKNAVFRAVLLCDGRELTMTDFPELAHEQGGWVQGASGNGMILPAQRIAGGAVRAAEAGAGLIPGIDADGEVRTLASAEEEIIRFAMAHYDGQISAVARRLGIGRTTLYRKLKEYGIDAAAAPNGQVKNAADLPVGGPQSAAMNDHNRKLLNFRRL